MIIGKTAEAAREDATDVEVNGETYTLSGYVGAAPVRGYYKEGNEANDTGEPQGFLVHQPPGAVTPPHFHETNQFQVIVGGSGTFAKHNVAPLVVQYANGHSPYGPIVSGDEGIVYFTLRARWDPGAKYMPASNDKLIKGNQRQRLAQVRPSTAEELDRRFGAEFDIVLDGEGDGLVAYMGRFGKNGTAGQPSAPMSGGQYWVVTAGSLLLDGSEYGELSCLFVSADEPTAILQAGGAGLEMLILQFPEKNNVGLAAGA